MVLLEFSISPLGEGESVSEYVARSLDLIDKSGLDYQLHAMGTIVEGELTDVLDLMRRCIEAMANDCRRVTCTAKLDYRAGHSGRLRSKVESVEAKIGRPLGRN
ncbi:MAG: MTH1187 family thiamine-binding protein [Pirellulales bacterium]